MGPHIRLLILHLHHYVDFHHLHRHRRQMLLNQKKKYCQTLQY